MTVAWAWGLVGCLGGTGRYTCAVFSMMREPLFKISTRVFNLTGGAVCQLSAAAPYASCQQLDERARIIGALALGAGVGLLAATRTARWTISSTWRGRQPAAAAVEGGGQARTWARSANGHTQHAGSC